MNSGNYPPLNVDKNCGIYRIKNMRNGKCYIGSSKNLKDRKQNHFKELRGDRHGNSKLQNAFNKETDKSVFDFQVFICCKEQDLIPLEQKCIDIFNPTYNLSSVAGRIDFNEEVLRKMSEKRRARTTKPETKVKTSLSLIGKPKSEKHAQNISAGRTGMKFSEKHKQSLRAARQERINKEALIYWGA